MIPEVFLTCALAMSMPESFRAHHVLVQSAEFVHYGKQLSRSRFLVVGGDPSLVVSFRNAGLQAFGALTEDVPGVTPWHVIANVEALAFKPKLFSGVYWIQVNQREDAAHTSLREAVKMVTPTGYLLFSDYEYEHWPAILKGWGWLQMPFRWNDFVMWVRPGGGNPRKIIPKLIQESA